MYPQKGYKLTKQGRSIVQMGWRPVSSDMHGGKMLSTMTMDTDSAMLTEADASSTSQEHLLFKREVRILFLVFLYIRYYMLFGLVQYSQWGNL